MNQDNIMIRKANGQLEPFDLVKLEHSLRRSQATPELIQKVIQHMVQTVEEGMSTHEIYSQAFSMLHNLEKPAAARYSLRRAIMSMGPSGFPFERIVAEILETQGYTAITDQVVMGGCVDHEIDVVAWKPNNLVMVEVKYHNELGMKSDLKVVLYVKARFEDLAEATYTYGGENRNLTEGWLVTNTKFSLSAIKYAECKNLKIIGWNYPVDHGLKEMIERSGVHPITMLNALSEHDKKQLLERKVVSCKSLKAHPTLLKDIGLSDANIEAVLEEIDLIEIPRTTERVAVSVHN